MLRRRSIRTKLIVALTLLSAIVLLLAFSGFWGLYRYKRLVQCVNQRADEIPLANDLHRLSLTLRESHDRSRELRSRGGMIHSGPICESLFNIEELEQLERNRFIDALIELERRLDGYENAVLVAGDEYAILVDNAAQRRSLREIRNSLTVLLDLHDKPRLDVSRREQLADPLSELVRQTEDHLAIINDGMAVFSDDVSSHYRTWISMAWSCTILAISMVGLLLWSFRSLVLKPFHTLLDGSRLVAGGQFDHRIDLGTGDELSELAQAMNEMTDRFQGALAKVNSWCTDLDRQVRERTREVIQNEQLASVGFLAAGVAHEINNPLASVAWSAESLQSRMTEIAMSDGDRIVDDELYEALTTNLRRIEEEAYRCKGITEKLLDFSRLSEARRAATDLVELVEDVVTMVGNVGEYRCKTLRTHSTCPVIAHVNPQEIRQVVLNLLTNALESVDCDGAVDVYIDADETCASVIVRDNGCGMSQEVLRHLFEPFFTRRRNGRGTGLGLSITYRIVSQHGGSLIASSEGEGCGSQMEMLLPLHPECKEGLDHRRYSIGFKTMRLNHEPQCSIETG